tara:strand:- start:31 stop:198 length:168 start_codon:yes stop_codon:yes gene_type:complete
MTQLKEYEEQFKKALNEYIELGFNQDECSGFMQGFHKGALTTIEEILTRFDESQT